MKYNATIKVLGKTYKATGSSVTEALSNLKPINPKTVSVLTISNGEISKEKILNMIQTFRLFCKNRIMHEMALKNISSLFSL